MILILISEFVRTNMGCERVRDIQENDDTEEPRTSTTSFEYDRAKIWPHTCILDV